MSKETLEIEPEVERLNLEMSKGVQPSPADGQLNPPFASAKG